MLFNSYEFLLVFLPATLVGFFVLGARSRPLALGWLIVTSLAFYAWWRPLNVLIIAPSIAVNFVLARALLRLRGEASRSGLARLVLAAGIAFNIAFLGYFKYVNFLATTSNDILGTQFALTQVILPLGISFITFQKIAFLIDVYGGRIGAFTLRDYGLFVLFFPQLIAGPIVHYREMMPQFQLAPCRPDANRLALGLTLLAFGLFKKVVLADGIAEYVSPIYDTASDGKSVSFFAAWTAAVGFTLQIYFDFSGYSDMAIGIAQCFGIRLPANFDSPLRSSSIIDFWLRWHITLTRFLTAYLYNPLVLWLTRRRLARGRPALGGRRLSVGAFFQLLVGPTLLTMLVSGIWHGAGYLFIAWGLLHGVYLCVNHAWRTFGPRASIEKAGYERRMRPIGFALTFVAVAFAMVLFRSPHGAAALEIVESMVGLHGIGLPQPLAGHLTAPLFSNAVAIEWSLREFASVLAWIGALLTIALLLPNTLQLTAAFEPALGVRAAAAATSRIAGWRPNLPWASIASAVAVAAVLRLGGKSEFLYWQF